MITTISKSDEIAALKRTLEKTRATLSNALDATVSLSTRNSELRAAIWATLNENPELAKSSAMRHLVGAVETQTGEGK